jgi:hypothetical protein
MLAAGVYRISVCAKCALLVAAVDVCLWRDQAAPMADIKDELLPIFAVEFIFVTR